LISLLLQIISLVVFSSFSAHSYSDDTKVSVLRANTLSIEGKILLIDIRSEQEWQQTGVAPQAVTLSMHQLGGIPAFEKSLTELLNNNKDQPIALICAGGVRSAKLQRYLHQRGFTQVLDVIEGMQGVQMAG
jgi:rhodanese-related sulfurtransferase